MKNPTDIKMKRHNEALKEGVVQYEQHPLLIVCFLCAPQISCRMLTDVLY